MSPTNTSICKHAHPAILHKTVPAIRTGFLFFLMASYALLGPRDTKCSGILGAVQINIQQTDLQIASTKLAGIFKAGERNLLRTWSSHEIGACCPLDCPTHLICLQKRVGNLHLHLESQHVTPTSNRSIHTSRHSKGSHKTQHSHTATHCNTGNTRQHTATHCNTLQHTATPCNTLPKIVKMLNARCARIRESPLELKVKCGSSTWGDILSGCSDCSTGSKLSTPSLGTSSCSAHTMMACTSSDPCDPSLLLRDPIASTTEAAPKWSPCRLSTLAQLRANIGLAMAQSAANRSTVYMPAEYSAPTGASCMGFRSASARFSATC